MSWYGRVEKNCWEEVVASRVVGINNAMLQFRWLGFHWWRKQAGRQAGMRSFTRSADNRWRCWYWIVLSFQRAILGHGSLNLRRVLNRRWAHTICNIARTRNGRSCAEALACNEDCEPLKPKWMSAAEGKKEFLADEQNILKFNTNCHCHCGVRRFACGRGERRFSLFCVSGCWLQYELFIFNYAITQLDLRARGNEKRKWNWRKRHRATIYSVSRRIGNKQLSPAQFVQQYNSTRRRVWRQKSAALFVITIYILLIKLMALLLNPAKRLGKVSKKLWFSDLRRPIYLLIIVKRLCKREWSFNSCRKGCLH